MKHLKAILKINFVSALVLLLAFSIPAYAASNKVSATIEPAQIAIDEAAHLAITTQGTESAEPIVPDVDGLEITPAGQSTTMESINGAVTTSVSRLYQVTATKAGNYKIPPIEVDGAHTAPLTLQVDATSADNSIPPSVDPRSASDVSHEAANSRPAFLKIIAPKQKLYVGENLPVQIKAYFLTGMSASLNGLPTLSSDAFTMSKLTEKPMQTQELVGGTAYTVLTWPATLSAVKAGDFALNIEMPVVVRVQDRRPRAQMQNPFKSFFGNSPFDDSFMDDSLFDNFFGHETEKQLTLNDKLATIKIAPLPTSDVPANFSGAVGQFNVHAEVTPTRATAGDPLTLKLIISGTGNFDRVDSNGLSNSASWKTYKPSSSFQAADSDKLKGSKVFEQAIVPTQSGQVTVPAIEFSYFDPRTEHYVTRQTQTLPVEVTAASSSSAIIATTQPIVAAAASNVSAKASSSVSEDQMYPNAVEPGHFVKSLKPILFNPLFAIAFAISTLFLVVGIWLSTLREKKFHEHAFAQDATNQIMVRENLEQMDSALKSGEAPRFFACARSALQAQLAQNWHLSPNAVTVSEINNRLNGAGTDIRSIFQAADQATYAGQDYTADDLINWQKIVKEQLKHLESL